MTEYIVLTEVFPYVTDSTISEIVSVQHFHAEDTTRAVGVFVERVGESCLVGGRGTKKYHLYEMVGDGMKFIKTFTMRCSLIEVVEKTA